MKIGIIGTLLKNDLKIYLRSQFLFITSLVALAIFLTVYFLIPDSLEEQITIGVQASEVPEVMKAYFTKESTKIKQFNSLDTMKQEVEQGKIQAGVVLTDQNLNDLYNGRKTSITTYFPPNLPQELDQTYVTMLDISLNEIAYFMQGFESLIEVKEKVLGVDLRGEESNPRQKMVPLFIVMIMMMDLITMGTLIVEEKENKTLNALLLTRVDMRSLFIAKGFSGIGLGFIQAIFFLSATGNIIHNPLLIIIIMLLGAVLITGIAFFIAAIAKDMLSVVALGVLFMIIIGFPAFAILFPGLISQWIKLIPTYHLVMPLYQIINLKAGLTSIWQSMLILLGAGAAILWLGAFILRRNMR